MGELEFPNENKRQPIQRVGVFYEVYFRSL